jgi:hypothetical protein
MIRFTSRDTAMLCLLSAALLATRFNHFGSPANPPDATLAVLFLAGWYADGWPALAILLAFAGLADALSIAGGVSAWCVTPAYWFLIPAYTSLWVVGRWAGRSTGPLKRVALAMLALAVGVVVFFVISNASFYLLSGYFGSMTASAYARAVARYLPHYLETAALYVAIAALIDRGVRLLISYKYLKRLTSSTN